MFYEWHDFPLDTVALTAAVVARALPPDRYEPFIDVLLRTQDKWAFARGVNSTDELAKLAALAGMPRSTFDQAVADEAMKRAILAAQDAAATKYGINSTPTFRLNDKPLVGAVDYATFSKAVDAAEREGTLMPAALARLRIAGFKSFAEAATVELLPGLTGIVGPNGCGKSNVVEALRWAMGEGNARTLRGEGMDDVIFAGTALRPARNLAEVAITLEESGGLLPPPLHAEPELHVVRRIERGGGSQYRVNGRELRARDVQTLFADLASGARASAMVSQGRVGALINARPDERRQVLEEAAGIAGLHSRRAEAETRLRAAEANLTRVMDARGAREQELAGLRRQARQAARYRALVGQIREAEGALLALQHGARRGGAGRRGGRARPRPARRARAPLPRPGSPKTRRRRRSPPFPSGTRPKRQPGPRWSAPDCFARARAPRRPCRQPHSRTPRGVATRQLATSPTPRGSSLPPPRRRTVSGPRPSAWRPSLRTTPRAPRPASVRRRRLPSTPELPRSRRARRASGPPRWWRPMLPRLRPSPLPRRAPGVRRPRGTASVPSAPAPPRAWWRRSSSPGPRPRLRDAEGQLAAARAAAEDAERRRAEAAAVAAEAQGAQSRADAALARITAEVRALSDVLAVRDGEGWAPMVDQVEVAPGLEAALARSTRRRSRGQRRPRFRPALARAADGGVAGAGTLAHAVKAPPALARALAAVRLVEAEAGETGQASLGRRASRMVSRGRCAVALGRIHRPARRTDRGRRAAAPAQSPRRAAWAAGRGRARGSGRCVPAREQADAALAEDHRLPSGRRSTVRRAAEPGAERARAGLSALQVRREPGARRVSPRSTTRCKHLAPEETEAGAALAACRDALAAVAAPGAARAAAEQARTALGFGACPRCQRRPRGRGAGPGQPGAARRGCA